MRRRPSKLRQVLRWAGILGLLFVIGWGLRQALRERDIVGVAEALRKGDPAAGRPGDPLAALSVLEPFLVEHPFDYAALDAAATALAELRSWDKAVATLRIAAEHAADDRNRARALIKASDMLMLADRYDEAMELGQQVVDIFPEDLVWRVRLGHLAYKGSQSAQQKLVDRFVNPGDKSLHDLQLESHVESYVSDVWSTPSLEELVRTLLPLGDPVLEAQIRAQATEARERFLDAYHTLLDYPRYGRFEAIAARAWAQCLRRAGRLYDAYVEAGIALREPNLPVGLRRDFLEVQAECAVAVEEFGQAADIHQRIVDEHLAASTNVPPRIVWTLYDLRVQAGHWEWIETQAGPFREAFGDDAMLRYALAAAYAATDRLSQARDEILEPFAAATLGTKSFTPPSVRAHPARRRAIAMLAYQLFKTLGDSRALSALDGLLLQIPDDVEALRLRYDLALSQDRLESAANDAFALLSPTRRDAADFERWLAATDRRSVQAFGKTLAERALAKVEAAERWHRGNEEATFATYKLLGLIKPGSAMPTIPDQLHLPREPDLSFAIVEDLVRRGQIERARDELRKLVNVFPGVQEFRFRLGRLLVREGLYDSAIAEFRRLLDEVPEDVEVLELAVRTETARGAEREAARLINAMVLQEPLGIGAVRAVQALLDRADPQAAQRLIERLVRWTSFGQRPDILALAGRTKLLLGEVAEAEAILGALSTATRDSVDVALLGLDIGLAKGQDQLVQAAVEALVPLAPGLFPDQMEAIGQRLLQAGLLDELAAIFRPEIAALPAARPALRAVATASKALGRIDEADGLLARAVDEDAELDRFLLLALDGRVADVGRRLRLETPSAPQLSERHLHLLIADALSGLPVLIDARPGEKLAELGAGARWEPAELQLLDALLRFFPAAQRLSELRPAGAVQNPLKTWPLAGADAQRLFELAATDVAAARVQAERLLYLLLAGERPFWEREARELAQQSLLSQPGFELPLRVLARAALRAGEPLECLRLLEPLLAHSRPSIADLRMVLSAARELDRGEWGMAVAFLHQDDPAVLALIAETLLEWGHAADAVELEVALLTKPPVAPEVWPHALRALSAAGRHDELVVAIETALQLLPADRAIAEVAAAALAILPRPTERAVLLAEVLFAQHRDLYSLGETIARARSKDADPAAMLAALESLVSALQARTEPLSAGQRTQLPIVLARAARLARGAGALDLAQRIVDQGLELVPGDFTLFREQSYTDLILGRADRARRALDLLSFVDLNDQEAALALARLDFRQLGVPTRAADVIRRSFPASKPLEAIEILSAEAYLRGRPADAITLFMAVGNSPLITAETYLTVARIAYTAQVDDGARRLFDLALAMLSPEDPLRARTEYLRNVRLKQTEPAQAAAQP
ncbi:MAG: tetratricopeptide repeat protein [Planctomycetota bacterium]